MIKRVGHLLFGIMFALLIQVVGTTYGCVQDYIEKNSSVQEWIIYDELIPAIQDTNGAIRYIKSFRVNDRIGFVSMSDVKRRAKITWYDTLYCGKNIDSINRRLKTQVWVDVIDIRTGESNLWNYDEEKPQPSDNFCQLKGKLVLETPRGFKKEVDYKSPVFGVNK